MSFILSYDEPVSHLILQVMALHLYVIDYLIIIVDFQVLSRC